MIHIATPPEPPKSFHLGYDGPRGRMRVHLWQIWLTFLTVLGTTWLCMLGPIPAVLAVVTAKHVLVAILAMGLRVDAPRETV